MSKPVLGAVIGTLLGLLDGLSAWAYPEARSMILAIVVSSTLKGLLTGVLAGCLARRWQSMTTGILAGLGIGFALSSLAAVPVAMEEPARYFDIVLPGMLVGAIVGFVTQRYPRAEPGARQTIARVVFATVAIPLTLSAQQPTADPLLRVELLVGRWEGTSDGQPGSGTLQREYVRVLNSRFIREQNRSVYLAQPKNPKGEIHEHVSFFSYDRARKRIVFRQFHQEGFVNQYVEDLGDSGKVDPRRIVFTSEAIENIPAGFRARETYLVHGPDEVEEIFELAEPGKDFEVYSRAHLRRAK